MKSATDALIIICRNFSEQTQQTFLVFQDVFKTSSRRLQRNTFRLPRRLEDVFKTYLRYVFLKRLQDVLQDVFKTFSRRLQDVFQDVFKTCLQDVLQLCLQDILQDKKMLH